MALGTSNCTILGKTFVALTESLDRSDPHVLSFRLIGLALWDKYDQALELLQEVSASASQAVASDAVSAMYACLEHF